VVALCLATVRRTSAPGWPQTRIIEAWSTQHRLQLRGPRRCTGNSSKRGHEPSHLDRFTMTRRCHPNTISPSPG
jgi:hypothetical protein